MNGPGGEVSRRSFLAGMAGAASLGWWRAWPQPEGVPYLDLLPFLARPTTDSILLNARNGDTDAVVRPQVRPVGEGEWLAVGDERSVGPGEFFDLALQGLETGSAYEYRLLSAVPGGDRFPVARGRFTTQRTGEVGFTAAMMTDAHTGTFPDGTGPMEVLDEVARNVRRERPDFVLALGDNVAWNTSRDLPQPDDVGARRAYTMYRRHMAALTMSCPHFGLIGNWEGESGKFPPDSTARVGEVRRRFTPNPDHLSCRGAVRPRITTRSIGGRRSSSFSMSSPIPSPPENDRIGPSTSAW